MPVVVGDSARTAKPLRFTAGQCKPWSKKIRMDDRWLRAMDHSELFAVIVGSAVKQVVPTVAHAPDRLSTGTGVAAVPVPRPVVHRDMSYTMEQSVAFGGPDGPT